MIKINLLPQIIGEIFETERSKNFVNSTLYKNFAIEIMLPCMPQTGNTIILNDYVWQKTCENWAKLINDEQNLINLFLMDFAEMHQEIDLTKWKPIDILNYFFHGRRPDNSVNEQMRDREKLVIIKDIVSDKDGEVTFDTRTDEIYIQCYFVEL